MSHIVPSLRTQLGTKFFANSVFLLGFHLFLMRHTILRISEFSQMLHGLTHGLGSGVGIPEKINAFNRSASH